MGGIKRWGVEREVVVEVVVEAVAEVVVEVIVEVVVETMVVIVWFIACGKSVKGY